MTPQAERTAVFSRLFGNNIARARDRLARYLIRYGVGADILTALGMSVTFAAVPFLALGAGDKPGSAVTPGQSWFGVAGGLILVCAAACDMLDGAVARHTGRTSKSGALLDSCCDRLADAAIFSGILWYYLSHPQARHSQLLALAAMVALAHAEIISYVKARAENLIGSCPVGYWQRGERIVGILLGLFSGHLATSLVMLAVLPGFTVWRRLSFACRQTRRLDRGNDLLDPRAAPRGLYRRLPWRHPRGSLPYDLLTALNIAVILFVDVQKV